MKWIKVIVLIPVLIGSAIAVMIFSYLIMPLFLVLLFGITAKAIVDIQEEDLI